MNCSENQVKPLAPAMKAPSGGGSQIHFMCNYCTKVFSSSATLSKHSKMHNMPASLKVKCFLYSKGGLSKNLKMNSLFECTYCKKLFAHKSNLTRHLRIHSGEKPFECNLCGKSFTSSSNLVQHVSTHAVQNPFKCGYCKKVFTKANELAKHIQSHLETRPGHVSVTSSSQSNVLSAPFDLARLHQQPEQSRQVQDKLQQGLGQTSLHSTMGETEGKPDHTYCSGSSQHQSHTNQLNNQHNLPTKDKNASLGKKSKDIRTKNKSYLIESTNQPLGADHTYWSTPNLAQNSGKKKTEVTKEAKSSHSNSHKLAKIKQDSGFDHTYCTGGSNHKQCDETFPENHNPNPNPLVMAVSKSRKEMHQGLKFHEPCRKPDDHTYSSGSNKLGSIIKKPGSQLSLSSKPLKPKQLTNRMDQHDSDHTYSVESDVQVECRSPNPVSRVNLVGSVHRGQPDHTYCHEKSKIAGPKLNHVDGRHKNLKDTSCLSVCRTDLRETLSVTGPQSQDVLDHTYCFEEQSVQKTTNDYDTDHNYCLDNGHFQDITCSDDWSSGMKFDHTYCLVRTVSRHF